MAARYAARVEPWNDIETKRLRLHAVDAQEARRIHDRRPSGGDLWAAGYPFEGDLAALNGFLRACDRDGDQRPFGYYQVARRSDGCAIGGIGFKGPPDAGAAEIGYGLVVGARGQGYVAEALPAMLTIASKHGVTVVRADTTPENTASWRILERSGFSRVAAGELLHYELSLA